MTPQPPSLDVVTMAIALAAAMFGPELATFVGPYAVIFLGAVLGGAWSASRRPPATRVETVGYLALIVLLAVLVTVPLADFAATYLGLQSRVLFAPVAAVISGVGPDWPGVFAWAWGIVRGIVERKTGGTQ